MAKKFEESLPVNQLTDLQKGYIAGIIDGEGTIAIHLVRQYRNGNRASKCFLNIANTNLQLVEALKYMIGCGTIVHHSRGLSDELYWKPLYNYRLMSRKSIAELLIQIRDYLIIKQKQADIMLKYIESRSTKHTIHTQSELLLIEEIRNMNKRKQSVHLLPMLAYNKPLA